MGLSRNEDILQSILDKTMYTGKPESRIEALLIAVADLIKSGGASPDEIKSAIKEYIDAHPELVAGVSEEKLNEGLNRIAKESKDYTDAEISRQYESIAEIVNIEKLTDPNLFVSDCKKYEGTSYMPSSGVITVNASKNTYVIPLKPNTDYYFTELCNSISQVYLISAFDESTMRGTLISSIYDYGVKGWNRSFRTPSNCAYIFVNEVLSAVKDDKYIGEGTERKETASGKKELKEDVRVLDTILLNRVSALENAIGDDFIVIGAGEQFTTIKDGFAYAVAHGLSVIIKAGVYNLVAEGINGNGYILPKKVIGYGAKLICDLPSENWALSPLNVDTNGTGTEVYGLEVECSNCRYCIHDEMGYMTADHYHNVFKDLKLTHKSEGSSVLIAPQCIGGGLGQNGYVEIENCVCESHEPSNRDIAYHSMSKKVDSEYVIPTKGNVVICKDCYLSGRFGFANSQSYTSVINKAYVSNCSLGVPFANPAKINIELIKWNNEIRA